MELSLISQLASLGLGAVIAGVVLIWKRNDDQKHQETLEDIIKRLEARDDRALKVIEITAATMQSLQKTIEAFAILDRLEERIVGLESNLWRKKNRGGS